MKRIVLLLYTLLTISSAHLGLAQEKTPHIITFFFTPLTKEQAQKKLTTERLQQKLDTPGKISQRMLKNSLLDMHATNGIFVLYAGYSAVSDINGQVMFPRKNQKPQVKILVTQSIKPLFNPTVPDPSKTLQGWQIIHPEQASYYLMQLIKNPKTNTYVWQTTEQMLPKNLIVPDDAIIIFADPDYISIPTGNPRTAANSPHFMLPDIYVNPKITNPLAAIRFLKIRKYFAPVPLSYKFGQRQYSVQVAL